MASLTFPQIAGITANLPHLHLMAGRVLLDATTPVRQRGKGYTVAKTATGRYTITLNRKAGYIIAALGLLRKPTGEAVFLTAPVQTDEQNIEFRVENASASNTDAASTDTLEFLIVMTKTRLSVA
jgi:hypothetical protein